MYFLLLSAFICGSILVFLGALGGLGGSIIVLGSLGVSAVQLSLIPGGLYLFDRRSSASIGG